MSGDLPQGACDSHCHVFGPAAEFPFAADRTYTPADAPKAALFALHRKLGLDRAVIVHPGAHGFDNSVTLDAIAASGGAYRGRRAGAGNCDTRRDRRTGCRRLARRAFQFRGASGAAAADGRLRAIVERIAPFGWHVVMHLMANDVATIQPYVENLPVPLRDRSHGAHSRRDGRGLKAFPGIVAPDENNPTPG